MSVSQYQTGPPFSCSPVVHQIEGRRSPGFSNSRNATKWRYSSRGYRLRTSANKNPMRRRNGVERLWLA